MNNYEGVCRTAPAKYLLEDAARYAGLLLAPAEGFGLRPRAFFALRAKKGLIMLFWPILGHFWCPVVIFVTGCPSIPKMGTDGQTCPSVPKLGTDGHPVTKVTTGHQKLLKMGQTSIISPFFPEGQKQPSAEGRSPPQELEVGLRSGPYLLVTVVST